MKTIAKNWQLALRIILILVAVAMIIVGFFQLNSYYRDEKTQKTAITATIVKNSQDNDEQLLHYKFLGEAYTVAPRDKFIHSYGKVGNEIEIFVQNSNPSKAFFQKHAKGEETLGAIFLGWGLLLILIAWLERRLLGILKRAEKFEIN
ncbi:hypothetical protein [Lactovum miscens]|uniref:DUF3592 domain-containing protein n=1 Tax=Lactovum miscens TaxID=190387 RepID=A0A841CBE3_9LACT|nr:hypothetical protein [Lactovum miscens]MBB5888709.1 hypothetical protein [Lactovum miscens]